MKVKFVIQYRNKYVGGFSFKTGKVWLVPQKEQAKTFTGVKANEFLTAYAGKIKSFEYRFITLVKLERKNFQTNAAKCKHDACNVKTTLV